VPNGRHGWDQGASGRDASPGSLLVDDPSQRLLRLQKGASLQAPIPMLRLCASQPLGWMNQRKKEKGENENSDQMKVGTATVEVPRGMHAETGRKTIHTHRNTHMHD
jgi:hypothetical protein